MFHDDSRILREQDPQVNVQKFSALQVFTEITIKCKQYFSLKIELKFSWSSSGIARKKNEKPCTVFSLKQLQLYFKNNSLRGAAWRV